MIKIQVIGYLGKDATVNETNGKKVINFGVAHSETYKDAHGAKVTKTTWVVCSYWTDKTAVAAYLKKGTQVFVEGVPVADLWQSKEGAKATQRCTVSKIELLGGVKAADQASGPAAAADGYRPIVDNIPSGNGMLADDDPPF